MTRARLIGVVVAAGLVVVAVWLMTGRHRGRGPGVTSKSSLGPAGFGPGAPDSAGGVAARPTDPRGAFTVSGHVVDADGQAMGHGSLVLTCLKPGGDVAPIEGGVVSVGEDGAFEGPGCPFEVCAELRHPYATPAEAWVLRPSEPAELRVRRLPRFDGEVVGNEGGPAAGATVTFTRPVGDGVDPAAVTPFMTRSTTTDVDGRFSVAWIERPACTPCQRSVKGCEAEELRFVDTFVVSVRSKGFGPARREVSIDEARAHEPDDPMRFELPRSADILSGRIVDPVGRPYPRVYVLARSAQRPSEQRRGEVVGEDFEIDGLGEGTYEVRALQDGVELARMDAVTAGDDVPLTGSKSAAGPDLRVVVRDERGRPLSARVDGGPFRDAATDDAGGVEADQVLPGPMRLRVRVQGAKAVVRQLEIPAAAVDSAAVLEMDLVVAG